MPYQMHPSGREKGEFFHFAFKNQILEDGKEIRPSFPFDALYAVLKLIESRKGFPVRVLSLRYISQTFFSLQTKKNWLSG